MIQFVVRSNNTITMFRNGKLEKFLEISRVTSSSIFSPEQIRNVADAFYLRPLTDSINENAIWYSTESLSPTILDQILNRLKLLPDFYHQTKPVETSSGSSNGANTVTSTTTPAAANH